MSTFKPMLAAREFDRNYIKFPCYCTPKIDGIRASKVHQDFLTRSLKKVRNYNIYLWANDYLPDNLDGELFYKNFQESDSIVMSYAKENDIENIRYHVFDCNMSSGANYLDRIDYLRELELPDKCIKVLPVIVHSYDELVEVNEANLTEGYEGTIIRSDGKYKFGRATLNEGLMMKFKNFVDDEATIIGFKEKMHNTSSIINELGYMDKTSKKSDLVPTGVLGSFICDWNGMELSIGSGLNDEQRSEYWIRQDTLLGRKVKFKYFNYGIKDKPRHPIFLGLRHEDDL